MAVKHTRGVLLCSVAALAWGSMFQVMAGALTRIDPFTFTCLRYAVAGLAFVIVLLAAEGRGVLALRGERVGLAWLFGTAGFAGYQFLVFYGQQLAGPQGAIMAAILSATTPMLALLVNRVTRRETPSRTTLGFVLLAFLGVVLVVTDGDPLALLLRPTAFGADVLIVLGSLCWAVYTMGGAFFPDWSPMRYTGVTTGLGLVSACAVTAVLLLSGAVAVPTADSVGAVLPELAYMSLVAGFVAVLAWNYGNRMIGAANGVLFEAVVPVVAVAVSALAGAVPVPLQLGGAVLTTLAVVGNNVHARRQALRSAIEPASAQVHQHRQHPAVVGRRVRQAEFAEDLADVPLHGVAAHMKLALDGRGRATLGQQPQHVVFQRAEGGDRIGVAADSAPHQPGRQ